MHIVANGISLNVTQRGYLEPALVLLHYWGGSINTWGPVIADLDPDRRIIAFDLRGWGESDKPDEGYRIEELADDVEAALRELRVGRFVLAGHSMGGKVAQMVASRHPAGLEGLILVAPASPRGTLLDEPTRSAMTRAYDDTGSILQVLGDVLTSRPLPEALKSQVVADSLKGGRAAKLAWPTVAIAQDISAAAAKIAVPTLVISGEFDRVDPPGMLREAVLGTIPGAVLEIVPNAGHLLPLEAPQVLAARIGAFLTRPAP